MTTKHTPGPWVHEHDWNGLIAIKGADGEAIAILTKLAVGTPGSGIPVDTHAKLQTANAHLLAAAPDLLAALQAMLDVQSARRHPLGAPDEGIATLAAEAASMAIAAIAKATPE